METMRKEFSLPVGLSDHTEGITAALSAVALGSVIIEKHLTLDRSLPGPDHRASIEPTEFTEMVEGIRQVTKMLGDGFKKPSAREKSNRPIVRKSLVAAMNIKDGDILSRDNLTIKRPGTGRSPMEYWDIIGSTSTTSYSEDDLI
jgi:N-acetylneuraminate synthase